MPSAGGVEGLVVHGRYELEVVLREAYPQLLYWFAMPFTAPVPWEAIDYYDGEGGRPFFKEHPVASGPFQVARYEQHSRIVLERNPNWYGALHPEWRAPGAIYPSSGEPGDAERGLLAARVRRPAAAVPRSDRVPASTRRTSPRFNKFLQGYYDASGIIQESFDRAVQNGGLSPAMEARGMALAKSVEPAIFYIGFNMKDPVVGAPGGARARKLRQAMSLAIDAVEFLRIFNNGRGVPAQSPIPPGIFGYDADYTNPYRTARPRARARAARRGRLSRRDRSEDAAPAAPHVRRGQSRYAQPAPLPVLGRLVAPDRARRRDRRPALQRLPGQGPPRRVSDLHVGLDRRLSRPRELPVPALGSERELDQPGRAEHLELRRSRASTRCSSR